MVGSALGKSPRFLQLASGRRQTPANLTMRVSSSRRLQGALWLGGLGELIAVSSLGSRIAANGSTVFRAANGQWMTQKNLDVLTDDDAWFSRKKKPSPASASDLAAVQLISNILTAGAPSLLGTKLVELQVAYGTLKVSAD